MGKKSGTRTGTEKAQAASGQRREKCFVGVQVVWGVVVFFFEVLGGSV